MKTESMFRILKTGTLALCCAALFTACHEDENDVTSSAPTMGDPKSNSPSASRCYTVSQFIEDGEDETDDYANIVFEFFNSGTVVASSPAQEWEGSWFIGFDDGVQQFFLNFSGTTPLLNELTDDWVVVSLSNNNPQFIEEGGGNPDVLQFVLSDCEPTVSPPSPELEGFIDNLTGDAWSVSSFIDAGDDDTNDFANTTFTFNADGTVLAQRFSQQRTGQWAAGEDDGVFELMIQFSGPALLNELNEDWKVAGFSSEELQLEDVGPGDADFLTFSRTSPPSTGLQDFNDNLLGGSWTVSNFIDDGQDDTNDFNNTTFTFSADGSVLVQRFNQQRTGQWSATENNGTFKLIFQFSGPEALNELNEDWDVVSFSANELQLEDADGAFTDQITFNRN